MYSINHLRQRARRVYLIIMMSLAGVAGIVWLIQDSKQRQMSWIPVRHKDS